MHLFSALLAAPPAAMTKPKASSAEACRVAGAERLPAGLDRSKVCAEIRQVLTQHGVRGPYAIDVEIRSNSRVAASLTVNGRTLPRQNLAVSDDQLSLASFRQLAKALADSAGPR